MRVFADAVRICVFLLVWVPVSAGCGADRPGPISPGPIVQPPPAPPPAAPPAPAPTLTVSRIVAFGDSMTEGAVAPPLPSFQWTLPGDAGLPASYPYKLKALIDARYTGQTISVVNAGWSGRQAREDAERLSEVLQQAKPELLLLFEGVNDLSAPLVGTEGPSTRIRSVVDALEEMIREGNERRQIPVLIATLPPQRPGGRRAWSIDLLPEFNASLRTMAAKRNATVVDLDQLPLPLIGDDGLHPTEAGYQRMAEVWLDTIKARYERAPSGVAR